jgi:hypothetical protein
MRETRRHKMNVTADIMKVEFDELLEKLAKFWTWDWAFFAINTITIEGKKLTKAQLSLMYGQSLTLSASVDVAFPTEFFWSIFSVMVRLHEDFDYTIIKGRESDGGFDIRIYRDGYNIPPHIVSRGVEYPWEGV